MLHNLMLMFQKWNGQADQLRNSGAAEREEDKPQLDDTFIAVDGDIGFEAFKERVGYPRENTSVTSGQVIARRDRLIVELEKNGMPE